MVKMENSDLNREPGKNPTIPLTLNPVGACLLRSAGDSAGGAVLGFVSGFGLGLIQKKGFEACFAQANSFGKTIALMCGLDTLIDSFLKRLRGKDDVINRGIAGCCVGIACSIQGPPEFLLVNCLSVGALYCLVESINEKQSSALALPLSTGANRQHDYVIPPLALPLPAEPNASFSSFCQSIMKK